MTHLSATSIHVNTIFYMIVGKRNVTSDVVQRRAAILGWNRNRNFFLMTTLYTHGVCHVARASAYMQMNVQRGHLPSVMPSVIPRRWHP